VFTKVSRDTRMLSPVFQKHTMLAREIPHLNVGAQKWAVLINPDLNWEALSPSSSIYQLSWQLQISNSNREEPVAEGQQWWELYTKEGHTVLISYFSPHPKREKKQCRKCPEISSEQAVHHVLALPLMASSNKFRCARVKIPPCSTHAFFNLLPGGSYTSSLSSKCLPCLCLKLVSSPSICNKLMVCSITCT